MKMRFISFFICMAAVLLIGDVFAGDFSLSVEQPQKYYKAHQAQKAYIRIGLLAVESDDYVRLPLNIAFVIDCSRSMKGERMEKTREAVISAVKALGPKDIVSVISYGSCVSVDVPASDLSDPDSIIKNILKLKPAGRTALFAGVSKGLHEIRKHADDQRISRLILVSDGNANVGPNSPDMYQQLGLALIKEGISVTTVGLGLAYNEDIMVNLSWYSDGNHYFSEKADGLADVFTREFARVKGIIARNVETDIRFMRGIKPLRILGRNGHISDRDVSIYLDQLNNDSEKSLVIEAELPPSPVSSGRKIASISVRFYDMKERETVTVQDSIVMGFSSSDDEIGRSLNKKVMVDVVEMIAAEKSEMAIMLRDKGEIRESQKLLLENVEFIANQNQMLGSEVLQQINVKNLEAITNLEKEKKWSKTRKEMKEDNYEAFKK